MIYGFEAKTPAEATAALLVYATWRSRDRRRFRVTPEVWGQVERFVKGSAKSARTLGGFLELLKPKLQCATLHPRAMAVGLHGVALLDAGGGAVIAAAAPPDQREFLTAVFGAADERAVLDVLYRETALVILLVRDRLERERPLEARFHTTLDLLDTVA